MLADIPTQGPCAGESDDPCRVVIDHVRDRKTGPEHPLVVVRCLTHGRGFTLYPPGHVPYGREVIMHIAPDESPLDRGERESPDLVLNLFEDTWFQAALDGAQGVYWNPYLPDGTDNKWWGTQRRRLHRAVDWLGLAPDTDEAIRALISEALDVEHLLLRETSHRIEFSPGYRSRAEAVHTVLDALSHGPCILDRMLLAGHVAGLWGRPLRWDDTARILRSPPFLVSGNPTADTPGTDVGHPRN